MGVDLRGRDRLVPQEIPDVPDVGAALEELGRVAVPEHVRVDTLAQPLARATNRADHHLGGDAPPVRGDEERVLPLCVNVGETSAPGEFSVEGGGAMRDEHG